MPETTEDTPQALSDFISTIPDRQVKALAQPQFDGNVWRIPLSPTSKPLDVGQLTTLDLKIVVDVHLAPRSNADTLAITNIPHGQKLQLRVTQVATRGKLSISDLHGTINIEGLTTTPTEINFSSSCEGVAQLAAGRFKTSVTEDASMEIEATNDAHLHIVQYVPKLRIAGSCGVTTDSKGQIGTLIVTNQSNLTITGQTLQVGSIKTATDIPAELNLSTQSQQAKQKLAIKATTISDVTLNCDTGHIALQVTNANGLTIQGIDELTLASAATADRLTATSNTTITAGAGAVLTALSGTWTLGRVANAHLVGSDSGFDIAAIEQRANQGSVAGTVLINFRLPNRVQRRQHLAALDSAYHLDPDVHELPGSGTKYNEKLPWRWSLSDGPKEGLTADAEFVRELARLAREKGAPGATRTRIAWCAYRLRHLASTSWWERRALDGYRLLGYGERPGPAFLTWLVVAAISASLTLGVVHGAPINVSPAGVSNYLTTTIEHALGPIGALLRTGLPETENWQYALRALVAIPLVTGALALRNYVKHGER